MRFRIRKKKAASAAAAAADGGNRNAPSTAAVAAGAESADGGGGAVIAASPDRYGSENGTLPWVTFSALLLSCFSVTVACSWPVFSLNMLIIRLRKKKPSSGMIDCSCSFLSSKLRSM
jgi:hypothetical protein